MKKQEYSQILFKMSGKVLAEELDIITDACKNGCSNCKHKLDDTTQCKFDVIKEVIKERV